MIAYKQSDVERFIRKVNIQYQNNSFDYNKCWNWLAYCDDRNGYGRFWLNGKYINSHKFMYIITFGQIDDDVCVCHTCDNPSCCNPYHFFQGTYDDNNKDRAIKNRSAQGINQGSSIISDDDLNVLVERLDNGFYKAVKDAAKDFNISQRHLYNIFKGKQKRKNLKFNQRKLNEIYERTRSSLNPISDQIVDEIIQRILIGELTDRSKIANEYQISEGTLKNILCRNVKRKNIKSTEAEIIQAHHLVTNRRYYLTDNDVHNIKYNSLTESNYELAKRYKVSQITISQIRNNKTWKHI